MLYLLMVYTDEQGDARYIKLYDLYSNDMMFCARQVLISLGDSYDSKRAEDVVQDVFENILEHPDCLDFERSDMEIKTYLLVSAENTAKNIMKRQTKVIYDDDCIEKYEHHQGEEEFFQKLLIRERYDKVVQSIGRLNKIYRPCFYYRYVQNMSVQDIAQLMCIPVKTVYTRLERGKALLLEMLGNTEEFNYVRR